jgi:protein TonB
MPIILAQATPPPAVAPASPEAATNPQPPKITAPAWIRKPTGEDIARVYPPRAASAGIRGRMVMKCGVTAEGRLADCTIVEETPPDEHFGDAGLRLSRLFRMRPLTKDGLPISGGTISIPIQFWVSR